MPDSKYLAVFEARWHEGRAKIYMEKTVEKEIVRLKMTQTDMEKKTQDYVARHGVVGCVGLSSYSS